MEMDRRTLLGRAGLLGLTGLAGCSSSDGGADGAGGGGSSPTGTSTGAATPSATPACGDTTYRDTVGEVSFEYGVATHNDPNKYDGTLRIYHVRTPVCNFPESTATTAQGDCEGPSEELLAERQYRVTSDLTYDVLQAPVSEDVDTYRLEWEAAGGTDVKFGVEEAARRFVDTDVKYEFFVCNPSARRFGFVVVDGKPRIVRSPTAE